MFYSKFILRWLEKEEGGRQLNIHPYGILKEGGGRHIKHEKRAGGLEL